MLNNFIKHVIRFFQDFKIVAIWFNWPEQLTVCVECAQKYECYAAPVLGAELMKGQNTW